MQEKETFVLEKRSCSSLKKDFGFSGWRRLFSRSFVRSSEEEEERRRRRRVFLARRRERKERRHHRSSSRRPYICDQTEIFDFSIPKRETTKKKRNEKHKIIKSRTSNANNASSFSSRFWSSSPRGASTRETIYIYPSSSSSGVYSFLYIERKRKTSQRASLFAFAFFEAKLFL